MQSVQSFIRNGNLPGLPGALEKVIRRLWATQTVHKAPAGARPEVLKEPDEATRIVPMSAAPLGENLAHHLAWSYPAQLQIARHVERSQGRRIDREQVLDVKIADIFEVPAGAAVARHPL